MKTSPRLTIGFPVYNGQKYMAESLDALLGQTYGEFELVIADNASTDGTAEIARRYEAADPRIRYVRHERNIGAAGNHNWLIQDCRTELFKWASADDLYAADLVRSCVAALDAHPEVILAHCWTAAVGPDGRITQAREYPLATDSPSPAVRLRSMLYGTGADLKSYNAADDEGVIAADDCYGVMRTDVVQRVKPHDSYYYADRTFMSELALFGRFHQTPDWLYFRRDHPDRAQHANPTVRSRCVNLDGKRADRLRHPTVRLLAEYPLGFLGAIHRAPISFSERQECYRVLARWLVHRGAPSAARAVGWARRRPPTPMPEHQDLPVIDVKALVPGQAAGRRAEPQHHDGQVAHP